MGDQGFSIALTGDSMITRRVANWDAPGTRQLIGRIHACDAAFTNLEVLPNNFVGYPVQESGGDHMAARDWVLDELTAMGFDLFAAAHNHALDYGVEGMLATMAQLERRNLAWAGLGHNLGEARVPAYFDTPVGSVGLLSVSSTFVSGQQASEPRPELPGRPGLNPLRTRVIYDVRQEHFAAVQAMADELGLEQQRQDSIRIGFRFPQDDPDEFPLGDLTFRASESPGIRREMNQQDLEEISVWVREARGRSNLVVVSLHAHEQGASKEEPADFIPEFCRHVIDQGADVVVGHGPHLLRGMEIYKGKPIFYSLGNFIDQHDLIEKSPTDAYRKFHIDPAVTPGEFARIRSQDDTTDFSSDRRYWQTVMPICHFEGGVLVSIEIVPVGLNYGNAVQDRGKPGIATGDEAQQILSDFARLSEPFGTPMEVEGERGIIVPR